jgi:hypothetical protein
MVIITREPARADRPGCWRWSVTIAVELGDRLLGTFVVDQRFAVGRRGDERSDGGVVERARQTEAGFVQACAGIVSDLSRAPDYAEQRAPLHLGRGSHTRRG